MSVNMMSPVINVDHNDGSILKFRPLLFDLSFAEPDLEAVVAYDIQSIIYVFYLADELGILSFEHADHFCFNIPVFR